MFPVKSAREIKHLALSVPCVCWLTPMPQKIIDFDLAKSLANFFILFAEIPHMSSTFSGL